MRPARRKKKRSARGAPPFYSWSDDDLRSYGWIVLDDATDKDVMRAVRARERAARKGSR